MSTNILIVDDSRMQVEYLRSILSQNDNNIFISYDGIDIFNIIEKEKIDVILLDVVLPYLDGFELLSKLTHNQDTTDIPVIMVTAITTSEYVEKALDMGAFDYIKKPAEPLEVIARVHSALRLKKKQDLLRMYSITDHLTNLYNRAHSNKLLQKFLSNISNMPNGISYAMIDCDFFKNINDNYGHIVGDFVLSSIGSLLLNTIKNNYIPGRYGGEEFSLILPDTSLQESFIFCEMLRNKIQKYKFICDSNELNVTVSIGLSNVYKLHCDDYLLLVNNADKALYKAKNKGRNRTEFTKFEEN